LWASGGYVRAGLDSPVAVSKPSSIQGSSKGPVFHVINGLDVILQAVYSQRGEKGLGFPLFLKAFFTTYQPLLSFFSLYYFFF
jgi:hypothetical protein